MMLRMSLIDPCWTKLLRHRIYSTTTYLSHQDDKAPRQTISIFLHLADGYQEFFGLYSRSLFGSDEERSHADFTTQLGVFGDRRNNKRSVFRYRTKRGRTTKCRWMSKLQVIFTFAMFCRHYFDVTICHKQYCIDLLLFLEPSSPLHLAGDHFFDPCWLRFWLWLRY